MKIERGECITTSPRLVIDSVLAAFWRLFLCLKIIITSYGIISVHKNIDLVVVYFYAVSPSRSEVRRAFCI